MFKLVIFDSLQEAKLGIKWHLRFKSAGRTLRCHQTEGKSILFKYHLYHRIFTSLSIHDSRLLSFFQDYNKTKSMFIMHSDI